MRPQRRLVLELFAVAGEMPLEQALARARAAAAAGFDAALAEHYAAHETEMAGTAIEFDDNPATVQGFNFGLMHVNSAIGPAARKAESRRSGAEPRAPHSPVVGFPHTPT